MIKAVIIDDEVNAQSLLEKTLERSFPTKFNIVAKCGSVDAGVQAIKQHEPELVFLDIQMPEKNGFELFQAFDVIKFEVIFTTAFNQFAIKAIKRSEVREPFQRKLCPEEAHPAAGEPQRERPAGEQAGLPHHGRL